MVVHLVPPPVVGGKEAVLLLLLKYPANPFLDRLAVAALARDMACGEERHDCERRDGRTLAHAPGLPGPVFFLGALEKLERVGDSLIHATRLIRRERQRGTTKRGEQGGPDAMHREPSGRSPNGADYFFLVSAICSK